ncbi:TVP38 TMEM64 family membrane [Chlorella sorokiniana]|uniref:TVP38 TMEM64 family membrane n=1 Tax=Chlorella sorokiniana TaxID=3076 RepID=A0A2P6TB98_CHLSO|nr:TVP38 TMEM64 family membrane [Chlorella sorokiniana]|eukprot:PRW05827.1 TVP38 TMEM64 family membrane [Chlorella sorokiniana]
MEIPLAEGRFVQPPAAAPLPPAAAAGPLNGRSSPSRHSETVSTDAAEYSEHARLVSSALSDDGMTPLIQPARTRKLKLLLFCKRLIGFVLSHWSKVVILAIIITLIVLVSIKGFGFFGDLLSWFQRHNGWAGWGIFVGMYTAMVALFLPGVVLILGAGFVFGFWRGLLAVWAGGAVGQALAFLLARYLFRDWVESTLKTKWKRWEIIDKAIEHDGWKLVLIMRFSPIIPYNLLNIAMATTSIPFWQFTVVSAVGIIYECAVFAYFGSMADNIHAIVKGEGGPPPVFEWVMLGVSALMCVVGALFVSYSIKQAIKRAQLHQLSRPSLGVGAGSEDGEQQQYDAELGDVRLHPSYPASLEREGFVRSSSALGGRIAAAAAGGGAYNQLPPSSPGANGSSKDAAEFELRAVGSSNAKEAVSDGRLLSVTAASGSGSSLPLASSSSLPLVGRLQTLSLPGRTGSHQPKQKISPKASLERMDSKYGSLEGDELGELGSARDLGSARAVAVRRHGSSGGERPML